MKIDITIVNQKPFCEIPLGEIFYYELSGTMWIRLDAPLFDKENNPYNAVALDDGIPAYFEDNDMVIVIPTKLVSAWN